MKTLFKTAPLQAHFAPSTSTRSKYAVMAAAGNDDVARRVGWGGPLKFLDESPDEPVLQPNAILPAQFYNGRRGSAGLEPVKRLMMAILIDAIGCYQRNLNPMAGRKRREFKEAESWLFERKKERGPVLVRACLRHFEH